MSTLNPFATLGLSPGASETDIKKSFRKMALVWHPDKNPHRKDEATKKFQDINDAYNVLTDAKTRREAEAKWRTTSKSSASQYYSYGSTPTSNFRGAGGWASSSSQNHWDDSFPDFTGTGWSYYGGFARQQQQQQSRSSSKPSRPKGSAYSYYAQRDNSNRYAYDSTPSGGGSSKFKNKKPRPKTETKPKPEPRAETKPRPTPKQETKPKPTQFEEAYSTPPQFKSTAGDPNFTRKTGYSYTSGERYRPGDTPNVKPPVYNQQEQEENHATGSGGTPFNFERQRQPHSSSGKGEKFRMYDEPPPKDKPATGSFNFNMPNMKTSEPSPASKSFREDHSFVFDQDQDEDEDEEEESEESDFSEDDLPDPNYKPTRKNPFGFNSDFVDLTGTDDEVEELSPDEYHELAKEAQRRKDQERREELINESKTKAQRARDMFGVETSSSEDDDDQDQSSDSDVDASMYEEDNHVAQDTQDSFFGSSMFNTMPFDKDVLSSMFNFSLGSDSPQAKPRRKHMATPRRRRPQTSSQTYVKSKQPYMEEVFDSGHTSSKTPFTPRAAGEAPPSKKVSPDFKQTPLFDINNMHPFNETNGNFGMDEIRNNIDQMGGDKIKTEKVRPMGEENPSSGRFGRRPRNTTSEPVNTNTSSAFRPAGASSYTKLDIDLATDYAQLIQAPDPPTYYDLPNANRDIMLAQYLKDFNQYQKDMETFYKQCSEYRLARIAANETHRSTLNSASSYRKANAAAREIDALVLEKEYKATRMHADALEKYDEVSNMLR